MTFAKKNLTEKVADPSFFLILNSLEQKDPSSFKYPHGLHKYLHLEVSF